MIVCLILFFFLCLSFNKGERFHLYEQRNLCTVLKYISALMVVTSHLSGFHPINQTIRFEFSWGWIAVCVFFFFSGYGVIYGFLRDGDAYLKSFPNKRFFRLIIPLLSAYVFYSLLYLNFEETPSFNLIFANFFSAEPFLPYSWYVSEIMLLYLVFFFVAKFSTKSNIIYRISACFLFFWLLLFILGMPSFYKCSTPCFLIGIIYCYLEDGLLIKNRNIGVIITMFLLFIIFCLCYNWYRIVSIHYSSPSILYTSLPYYIGSLCFILLFTYIVQGIKEMDQFNNSITNSYYEVYLVQGSVFLCLSQFMDDSILYYLLSILVIVILGVLFHKINGCIMNWLS